MSLSLEQINTLLGNPSWDLLLLFLFVVTGFFVGIAVSRRRMISFMVSLYVSGFIFDNFYYLDQLIGDSTIMNIFMYKIFFFFILVLASNVVLSSIMDDYSGGSDKAWWEVLILSFLTAGLFFSYLFHIFPSKEIFTFSPVVQNLFASSAAYFWWLISPIIFTLFIRYHN